VDLNQLLQKTQSSGNPDVFDVVLRTKMWEAEEEYRKRHSRPNSREAILEKYGAIWLADLGDPGPEKHLVEGFIAEGEPCYIYGARGTLKSYNALMIALGIASPDITHVFGHEVEKHGTVILYDAEMNPRRFNERTQALCRPLEIEVPKGPDYGLIYKNVVGRLPAEAYLELHEMIDALGAVAVVIDSWGYSTSSKPEDYDEQRADAAAYIDPILNMGCTPILVDHKPHQGNHLFGSVLKEYHARAIFQAMDRSEDGPSAVGTRRTKLVNEKMSHGEDGWAINLETTFEMVIDEETGKRKLWKVEMSAQDVPGGGFGRGAKPDSRSLVVKALEDRDKDKGQISQFTELSEKTLEKILPRMVDDDVITVAGQREGQGGALIYGLLPGGDGEDEQISDPSGSTFPPPDMPRGKKGEGKNGGGGNDSTEASTPVEKKTKKGQPASLLTQARVTRELSQIFNLIYRKKDVDGLLEWLGTRSTIALDTETYGEGKNADVRKKAALSFVRGRIRLIQLSDGDMTYLVDALLLKRHLVINILEALKGKTICGHNLIFDLPRIKRIYGVDLLDEELLDTMVLSRLTRAGEWEEKEEENAVTLRHALGESLKQEGVATIPKATDHRWDEPLTDERLIYAIDDVRYLHELHHKLMDLVEERNQHAGLEMYETVYREYMQMQYRGQPLDEVRVRDYMQKLSEKVEEARARIEEHKPRHPDGEDWSWGNKQAYDPEKARQEFEEGKRKKPLCPGRNGARRALAAAGVKIKNLQKPTRLSWVKKNPGKSPLLEALNDYYLYSDLLSDCQYWLEYYVEGGRIYANVNPFSQVTGRSAYSNPALQNSPKVPDPAIGLGLRDCIKPGPGRAIVKADYAAQELRIVAELVAQETGDTKLIEAFNNAEKDPHVLVGEKVAGHELVPGTDDYRMYRALGKRMNYGLSYGAGADTYRDSVFKDSYEEISTRQAKAELAAYRETWPGVVQWQKSFGSRSGTQEDHWYAESFIGRRRYVKRAWDKYAKAWKPKYTERLNAPVQSGGADMLYRAIEYLIADQQAGLYKDVSIIITTHDEVVLEAPAASGPAVKTWLEGAMGRAAGDFLREELAGDDCVEAEVVDSWGGK